MAFTPKALLLLLLAVVYVQQGEVLAKIPDRCQCEESSLVNRARRDTIKEFYITPKRPNCDKVEIILTQKPENKTTASGQLCLNPQKQQGQLLQNCWTRLNINNTDSLKMSVCWQWKESTGGQEWEFWGEFCHVTWPSTGQSESRESEPGPHAAEDLKTPGSLPGSATNRCSRWSGLGFARCTLTNKMIH